MAIPRFPVRINQLNLTNLTNVRASRPAPSNTMAVMANLASDNYYQVLGLSSTATTTEIKKAYRKLALQWHPDRHSTKPDEQRIQAETNFKNITEANDVLSDPQRRNAYDVGGKAASRNASSVSASTTNFLINPKKVNISHPFNPEVLARIFGDKNRKRRGRPKKGAKKTNLWPNLCMETQRDLKHALLKLPVGYCGNQASSATPPGQKKMSPLHLPIGITVTVQGVISRPDLNGVRGKVCGLDNSGKYSVQNLSTNKLMSLNPENLIQHVSGVVLKQLKSRPELNGQLGSIVGYEKGRLLVRLVLTGAIVGLSEKCLIFPKDTVVWIQSQTNSNDRKCGCILGFDNSDYNLVVGPDASRMRLKPENVSLIATNVHWNSH